MQYFFYGVLILFLLLLVLGIATNFRKVTGFFERLKVFVGEVSGEMRKVSWPTMDEVVNSTLLVVVTVFSLTVVLWIVDLVISKTMDAILRI